jgi:hypothetical protein
VNSPVTSAVELRARRMAIVACFVFQREISRYVFWDFFDRADVICSPQILRLVTPRVLRLLAEQPQRTLSKIDIERRRFNVPDDHQRPDGTPVPLPSSKRSRRSRPMWLSGGNA